MIEMRFHPEYYDGFSIDEAVKIFAPFAGLECRREDEVFIVKVEINQKAVADGLDERTIALELSNYALGLTIERVRGRSVQ